MVTIVASLVLAANPSFAAKAPELIGTDWLNTKPLTLASRRGKPTLVAFWTFACSNCQANLPAYDRLYAKYKPKGVELIAIHTPELEVERVRANVVDRVKRDRIKYPVLLDTEMKNWRKWNQQYWPTIYLLDKDGNIDQTWIGELAWRGKNGEAEIERRLEQLLK